MVNLILKLPQITKKDLKDLFIVLLVCFHLYGNLLLAGFSLIYGIGENRFFVVVFGIGCAIWLIYGFGIFSQIWDETR